MARDLDTPVAQSITQQAITGIRFEIPHIWTGPTSGMAMNKPAIYVWYEVVTYEEDGSVLDRQQRSVKFANWPAVFKTEAKAVYDRLVQDAESNGLILGPGTDEDLSA